MSLEFNETGFQQLVGVVRQLAEKVEALEARGGSAHAGGSNGATPRVKCAELETFANANPGLIGDDAPEVEGFIGTTDIYVYDVADRDIASAHTDRNTGLPGFWVQSQKGKRFLVDIMGVPFFLNNPLRAQAYKDAGIEAAAV